MKPDTDMTMIGGFEGGAVYTCEKDGRFLLVVNETVAFDVLDEEDQEGLEPVNVLEFSDEESREAYIQYRGWRNIG